MIKQLPYGHSWLYLLEGRRKNYHLINGGSDSASSGKDSKPRLAGNSVMNFASVHELSTPKISPGILNAVSRSSSAAALEWSVFHRKEPCPYWW